MTQPIEIVKIGGSALAAPERLRALLGSLADRGAPLVVVGGGGPFADAVRALEPKLALSAEACHRMAILGMEQTALALADLEPRLAPCTDIASIGAAHAHGAAALWQPAALAMKAPLPASWDVTSDSLALWLAIELGGVRLTLIKAAAVTHPYGPVDAWVADGLVDAYFPRLAQRFAGRVRAIPLDRAGAAFEDAA